MITSLALAGTLRVPVQAVTETAQKEKMKNRKSSYSVGMSKKEKVGLGVAGVVGVGVILEEVLRRKVFAKKANQQQRESNQTLSAKRLDCGSPGANYDVLTKQH